MPIRAEYKPFYQGKAWKETRFRILARANHCCEQCGKRNGQFVYTIKAPNDQLWGRSRFGVWRSCGDPEETVLIDGEQWLARNRIKVKIGVAHLNHVPGDDRDENLKALCDYCHLAYDQPQHALTRKRRKDAARPLLNV